MTQPLSEDSARVWHEVNGVILTNCQNMKISPVDGENEVRRGMVPDGKALGYREGQEPTHTLAFTRDVLKGGQDHYWRRMKKAGWRGTITEHTGIDTVNYYNCAIESVEGDADTKGKKETVTITALDTDDFQ